MTPEINAAEAKLRAILDERAKQERTLDKVRAEQAKRESEWAKKQEIFIKKPSDANADAVVAAKAEVEKGALFVDREESIYSSILMDEKEQERLISSLTAEHYRQKIDPREIEKRLEPAAKRLVQALAVLSRAESDFETIGRDIMDDFNSGQEAAGKKTVANVRHAIATWRMEVLRSVAREMVKIGFNRHSPTELRGSLEELLPRPEIIDHIT